MSHKRELTLNQIIQKTARLLPHVNGHFMILNTDEIAIAVEDYIKLRIEKEAQECKHISGGLGACPKCGETYEDINKHRPKKEAQAPAPDVPLNIYLKALFKDFSNSKAIQILDEICEKDFGRFKPQPAESSPIFCEHANEVPAVCPCPEGCYCKTHSCKNRQPAEESVSIDELEEFVLTPSTSETRDGAIAYDWLVQWGHKNIAEALLKTYSIRKRKGDKEGGCFHQ